MHTPFNAHPGLRRFHTFYDLLGNLVRIQQGDQNRYFKYDSMSRPTHARHPEQSAPHSATDGVTGNNNWSSATTYDQQGRVATTVDAKSVTTTLTYDGLNRVTQISYSDSTPTKKFKYGDDTSDSGNLPPTNANMKGRLWRAETDSTDGEKRVRTQINNYDNVGRVTSLTQQYRNSGNTAWGDAYTTLRTYGLTQLTGEEYPSNRTVSYSYDAVGRWTEVKGKLGTGGSTETIYSDSVLYDVWGAITREKLGATNVWVNERRNIVAQPYDKRAGKESEDFAWNRGCWQNYYSDQNETWGGSGTDNTGQVMKTQSHIPEEYTGGNSNNGASRARMFRMAMEYDSLGRLKRASETAASYNTDASWGESWTTHWAQGNVFDRYGNRTIDQNSSQTFNAVNSKNFSVDTATNRLGVPSGQSGTMTYDAMGQLTTDTYTRPNMGDGMRAYDADGRLTSARVNGNGSNNTESAVYNPGGQRVLVKNADGTSVRFVYGIDGELVAEYASSNFAAGSPTVEYAYRGGEVIVEARSAGNTWRITDSLGSVRTTLDASGNLVNRTDHSPFGEELGVGVSGRTGTTGPPNTPLMFYGGTAPKQKFTGLERDEKTSYDHTLWRKMDSIQGRWTSPDPYSGSMSLGNPQSLNRYTYVGNDPGNGTDPLGLCTFYVNIANNGVLDKKQLDSFKKEIQRIYGQAGQTIEFSDKPGAYKISLFKKASDHPLGEGKPNAVGQTDLALNRSVLNNGRVFKDRLVSSIEKDSNAAKDYGQNSQLLAVGLARAASHEIGHFLLQQNYDSFDIKGVMHDGFSGNEWIGKTAKELNLWQFTPEQIAIMNQKCQPNAPQASIFHEDIYSVFWYDAPSWYLFRNTFANYVSTLDPIDRSSVSIGGYHTGGNVSR